MAIRFNNLKQVTETCFSSQTSPKLNKDRIHFFFYRVLFNSLIPLFQNTNEIRAKMSLIVESLFEEPVAAEEEPTAQNEKNDADENPQRANSSTKRGSPLADEDSSDTENDDEPDDEIENANKEPKTNDRPSKKIKANGAGKS